MKMDRDLIGMIEVEDDPTSDNLAVVLCTYFEQHMARPDDDEVDGDLGWSPWTRDEADEALRRIGKAIYESGN